MQTLSLPSTTSFAGARAWSGLAVRFSLLYGLQQTEGGAFMVLDGVPFSLVHVPSGKRPGDVPVILRQLFEATGQQDADMAESLAGIIEVFQKGVQSRRMGRLPDELVEITIHA